MGRPYNKTHFDDPLRLAEMLALRYGTPPWSYNALGEKYGVDHSTIVYHVQKARRIGITADSTSYYYAPPQRIKRPKEAQLSASRYLWRVHIVGPTTPCVALLPSPQPKPPSPGDKYMHIMVEKMNPGRNYRDYRRAGKKRRRQAAVEMTKRLIGEFAIRVRRRGRINLPQKWKGNSSLF